MINFKTPAFVFACAVLALISACAGNNNSCPNKEQVKTSVQKLMPINFNVEKITGMKEVPGLCEVIITVGSKQPVTFYVNQKADYVLSGSIVEVATKRNITIEHEKAFK